MTTEEINLWTKISQFNLDDENASFQFSHRLARENGWTIKYAKQVIEEYKKFIFLSCICKSGVTPSDQVDQAWHLHLTFTKSYWIDFCRDTLNQEIHHNPTKGGKSEGVKFNDFYSKTLTLYREKFQIEPSPSIWPDNQKRFSDINFQRINLKEFWLIRKPKPKRAAIVILIPLSIILLSVKSDIGVQQLLIALLIICIGSFLYGYFGGNNNGSNECSAGGCNTQNGSDGHSGCNGDSGCGSSGCSGCGSGCGGGD